MNIKNEIIKVKNKEIIIFEPKLFWQICLINVNKIINEFKYLTHFVWKSCLQILNIH